MAPRGNLRMEFVQSQKARVATFQRRSQCLMKKAFELSKLCDVDVAVVIYAGEVHDRPMIYPPDSSDALRILQKFKNSPNPKRAGFTQKPENCSSEEQRFTRMNENKDDHQTSECDDDIRNLGIDELDSLLQILDSQAAKAENKIKTIKEKKERTTDAERFSETLLDESFDPDFFFSGDCDLQGASETTICHHRSELSDPQPLNFQWPTSLSGTFDEDLTHPKSIVSVGTQDLEQQGTAASAISDQAMEWSPSAEFSYFDMEDSFWRLSDDQSLWPLVSSPIAAAVIPY